MNYDAAAVATAIAVGFYSAHDIRDPTTPLMFPAPPAYAPPAVADTASPAQNLMPKSGAYSIQVGATCAARIAAWCGAAMGAGCPAWSTAALAPIPAVPAWTTTVVGAGAQGAFQARWDFIRAFQRRAVLSTAAGLPPGSYV